jgi:hypothetical protein
MCPSRRFQHVHGSEAKNMGLPRANWSEVEGLGDAKVAYVVEVDRDSEYAYSYLRIRLSNLRAQQISAKEY